MHTTLVHCTIGQGGNIIRPRTAFNITPLLGSKRGVRLSAMVLDAVNAYLFIPVVPYKMNP